MTKSFLLAGAAALTLAACGGGGSQSGEQNAAGGSADSNMVMENMATDNAASSAGGETASNGQEYATMAAASDMFEIESSRLARQKAQNADIKTFAQMLITDHQKSTRDLQAAVGQAQPPITLTPQMNPEQQANMQALQGATGAQFDQLYIQQQVPAHQKALALVQGYAQSGDVEGLKQHASTVEGPIQRHLQRAQELQTSVGQGGQAKQ